MDESENITYQNFWDASKPVFRGELTAISTNVKKGEWSQVNNLTLYLIGLSKEDQI